MTTFDRREEAFENLFVHDEEMHFRAVVHRARLFADWISGRIQQSGAAADSYRAALVELTVADGHEEALYEKARRDLAAARVPVSDAEIRAEMDRLMSEAVHHVREH